MDNLLSTLRRRDGHRSYYGNGEMIRANTFSTPFARGTAYDNNLGTQYGGRFAGNISNPQAFLSLRGSDRVQRPPVIASAPAALRPSSPLELRADKPSRVASAEDLIMPEDSASAQIRIDEIQPEDAVQEPGLYSASVHSTDAGTGIIAEDSEESSLGSDMDAYNVGYAIPLPDSTPDLPNETPHPESQGHVVYAPSGIDATGKSQTSSGLKKPGLYVATEDEVPSHLSPSGIPLPNSTSGPAISPLITPLDGPAEYYAPQTSHPSHQYTWSGPQDSWPSYDPRTSSPHVSPYPQINSAPAAFPYAKIPEVGVISVGGDDFSTRILPGEDFVTESASYKEFLMNHTWESSQRTDFGFSPPETYSTIEVRGFSAEGNQSMLRQRTIPQEDLLDWLTDTAFLDHDKASGAPRTRILVHQCHPSLIQDVRLLPFTGSEHAVDVLTGLGLPLDYFATMIGASQCPPLFTRGPGNRINLRVQTATPSTGFISLAVSYDHDTNITTGFLWIEEGFQKFMGQLTTLHRYASHPILYPILVLMLQNELFTRRNIELNNEIEKFNEKLEPGLRKVAEDDMISILALTNISTPKFVMETCIRIDAAINEFFHHTQRALDSEMRDFFRVVETSVQDNFQWHMQLKTQFEQERQAIYWMLQRQDTQIALKDSSRMKSIAILTMIFLPATAIATIFSMSPFFNVDSENDNALKVSGDFYVFWTVALPITFFVVTFYAAWTQRRELWKFLRHPTWYIIHRPQVRRELKSGKYSPSEERQLEAEIRLLEEDLGKSARARHALRRLASESSSNHFTGLSKPGMPDGKVEMTMEAEKGGGGFPVSGGPLSYPYTV